MARPNLLKIDDLLLRAGQGFGLVWLLGSAVGLVVAANAGDGFAGAIFHRSGRSLRAQALAASTSAARKASPRIVLPSRLRTFRPMR